MKSGHEDLEDNALAKAMYTTSIVQIVSKKAEKETKKALILVCKEMKRKKKLIDSHKARARKKTMRSYFQST